MRKAIVGLVALVGLTVGLAGCKPAPSRVSAGVYERRIFRAVMGEAPEQCTSSPSKVLTQTENLNFGIFRTWCELDDTTWVIDGTYNESTTKPGTQQEAIVTFNYRNSKDLYQCRYKGAFKNAGSNPAVSCYMTQSG